MKPLRFFTWASKDNSYSAILRAEFSREDIVESIRLLVLGNAVIFACFSQGKYVI